MRGGDIYPYHFIVCNLPDVLSCKALLAGSNNRVERYDAASRRKRINSQRPVRIAGHSAHEAVYTNVIS